VGPGTNHPRSINVRNSMSMDMGKPYSLKTWPQLITSTGVT
jgi:hypothetical protein